MYHRRTRKITIRMSEAVKLQLEQVWKRRLFPDPKDNKKQLPFKSEAEYIEAILDCVNRMDDKVFYLIVNWYNPVFF